MRSHSLVAVFIAVLFCGSSLQAGWSTDERVTADPANSDTETDGGRNIVVWEEDIFVVWSDNRDGNSEIYFREKIDSTWNDPVRLTFDDAASQHPAMGRPMNSMVRVVWEDHRTGHPEVYEKHRISGQVWSADSCLTCDTFASSRPSYDQYGTYVAWEETKDGNREIYLRARTDSGTWGVEERISDDPGESSHPSVQSSSVRTILPKASSPCGDHIIVAWQDDRDGNREIYARVHDDWGWGVETRLSNDTADSRYPSPAIDVSCGGVITIEHIVAWQDNRDGNEEIYTSRGFDGIWTSEDRLTDTEAPSLHPGLAPTYYPSGGMHGPTLCPSYRVVWEEQNMAATSGAIYYVEPYTGDPPVLISAGGAEPGNPSLMMWQEYDLAGIGRRLMRAVWTDTRDGNPEIYLAEGEDLVSTDVASGAPPVNRALSIGGNRPNPFNPLTSFSIDLPARGELSVSIHDPAGRLVRSLFTGVKSEGRHPFTWDGKSDDGSAVASGAYLISVQSESDHAEQKVLLVR